MKCLKITILVSCLCTFVIGTANAVPIARGDFGTSAVTVDFSDGIDESPVYSSGILTVTGGVVQTNLYALPSPMDIFNYTNNGGGGNPAGNPIRLDFSDLVSAVGADVYYNDNPVLFELYDSTNTIIESSLSSPTDYGSISGFIGLDVGADLISYAIFSVPALPTIHNLYIDLYR